MKAAVQIQLVQTVLLFHCMRVFPSRPGRLPPSNAGLWGNLRMSSESTFICLHCSLASKCFTFRWTVALLPGGTAATWWVIYRWMTQMSPISHPARPSAGDASAQMLLPQKWDFYWHHGVRMNERARRFDLVELLGHGVSCFQLCLCRTTPEYCLNQIKYTYVWRIPYNVRACLRVSIRPVFYCRVTKNTNRSIMKWTLVSCKRFIGAQTGRADRHVTCGNLFKKNLYILKEEIT